MKKITKSVYIKCYENKFCQLVSYVNKLYITTKTISAAFKLHSTFNLIPMVINIVGNSFESKEYNKPIVLRQYLLLEVLPRLFCHLVHQL